MSDAHTPVDVAAAPLAEGAVRIEVVRGLSERPAWTLAPGVWQVGRGRSAAVRLEDPAVSRVHCTLHVGADGRVRVEDAGSGNGTRLGGRDVHGEAEWDPSDLLEVGRVALRLVPSGRNRGRGRQPPPPPTEQEDATGDATTKAVAALVGAGRARRWSIGVALLALLVGLGVWTWMAPSGERAPASQEEDASVGGAGAGPPVAGATGRQRGRREPPSAAATRARDLRGADPVRALAWYEVARAAQHGEPGAPVSERPEGLLEAMRWEAARGTPWRAAPLDRRELPDPALDGALSAPWRVRVLAARVRLRRDELAKRIERVRAALRRGDLGAARAAMGPVERTSAGALPDPELAGLRALIERGDAVEAARAVRPEVAHPSKTSPATVEPAFEDALRRAAYDEAWRLAWQALRTASKEGAGQTWRTRLVALEDARVHRLLADRWSDAGRHPLAAAHLLEAAADLDRIHEGAGASVRHEAADLLAATAAAAQSSGACSPAVGYAAAALALDASQALAQRVRAWCRQEGERAMAQALLAAQSARLRAARAWALDALAALPDDHPMRARLREIAGNDPPPRAP